MLKHKTQTMFNAVQTFVELIEPTTEAGEEHLDLSAHGARTSRLPFLDHCQTFLEILEIFLCPRKQRLEAIE